MDLSENEKQFSALCMLAAMGQGRSYFNQQPDRPRGSQNAVRVFNTLTQSYELVCQLATGDYTNLYGAYRVQEQEGDDKVVIKIVDNPADNDLLQNELRVLEYLKMQEGPQKDKHLPVLLDRFITNDGPEPGEDGRYGLVLRYFDGIDALELRNQPRYRNGLPEQHVAWILERLLSVAGFAHICGVVHCNIEPTHLMIRPRDHNVCLLDWSYAAINPAQTHDRYRVSNDIGYSAPEILTGAIPHPSADIYSIGKCAVALLGGDVQTGELPDSLPGQFRRFIELMIKADPEARAKDAWNMYKLLTLMRRELWGNPKFIELEI